MKYFSSFLLILVLFFSCAQNSSKQITEVSQEELNKVIVVDVRTLEEYTSGHLETALNIDWNGKDFIEKFEGIDTDETIYVYCKKGGRSAQAQAKLNAIGFSNVVNLEGGYDAFIKK